MTLALTLLAAAFFSPAHAVDTSGCSQRLTETRAGATPAGYVTVVYDRAPRDNCWNADRSYLRVRYDLKHSRVPGRVSFWVSLNGATQTVDASVRCSSAGPFYAKDTRDQRPQSCVAEVNLPTRMGRQELEIAPIVDGQFDTAGYGQNVRLGF